MKLKNIKAAIFDMDGTLVDSLMIWGVLWERLGQKYLSDKSFHPSAVDDKKVRTLTLREAMQLIHENYNIGKSGEEVLDEANRIMLDFYKNEVKLKAGVGEFLEHLHAHGVKMCLATATAPELVSVALKHCDIEKYFSRIFSCSEIGKGKESPDVFLIAAEFLGEDINNTFVFEDSVVAIQTAVGANIPTVGIYDKFGFGQEIIKEIATEYIAEGETLLKLI